MLLRYLYVAAVVMVLVCAIWAGAALFWSCYLKPNLELFFSGIDAYLEAGTLACYDSCCWCFMRPTFGARTNPLSAQAGPAQVPGHQRDQSRVISKKLAMKISSIRKELRDEYVNPPSRARPVPAQLERPAPRGTPQSHLDNIMGLYK
eukprot:280108-Prorocentrum_minimum.AAC.2